MKVLSFLRESIGHPDQGDDETHKEPPPLHLCLEYVYLDTLYSTGSTRFR